MDFSLVRIASPFKTKLHDKRYWQLSLEKCQEGIALLPKCKHNFNVPSYDYCVFISTKLNGSDALLTLLIILLWSKFNSVKCLCGKS